MFHSSGWGPCFIHLDGGHVSFNCWALDPSKIPSKMSTVCNTSTTSFHQWLTSSLGTDFMLEKWLFQGFVDTSSCLSNLSLSFPKSYSRGCSRHIPFAFPAPCFSVCISFSLHLSSYCRLLMHLSSHSSKLLEVMLSNQIGALAALQANKTTEIIKYNPTKVSGADDVIFHTA